MFLALVGAPGLALERLNSSPARTFSLRRLMGIMVTRESCLAVRCQRMVNLPLTGYRPHYVSHIAVAYVEIEMLCRQPVNCKY